MADSPSHRQSPLAPLALAARAETGLNGAGFGVSEPAFRVLLDLRVDPGKEPGARAAFEKAMGFALPETPNTVAGEGDRQALWLGPDEWLIVVHDARPDAGRAWVQSLRTGMEGVFCAVVDVSHAQGVLRLSGPAVRDVLEGAVPLDMHPRAFEPGQVKQTLFGRHCGVTLHLVDDAPTFDLYCRRSFTEYVYAYLADCARGAETRMAVLNG